MTSQRLSEINEEIRVLRTRLYDLHYERNRLHGIHPLQLPASSKFSIVEWEYDRYYKVQITEINEKTCKGIAESYPRSKESRKSDMSSIEFKNRWK